MWGKNILSGEKNARLDHVADHIRNSLLWSLNVVVIQIKVGMTEENSRS